MQLQYAYIIWICIVIQTWVRHIFNASDKLVLEWNYDCASSWSHCTVQSTNLTCIRLLCPSSESGCSFLTQFQSHSATKEKNFRLFKMYFAENVTLKVFRLTFYLRFCKTNLLLFHSIWSILTVVTYLNEVVLGNIDAYYSGYSAYLPSGNAQMWFPHRIHPVPAGERVKLTVCRYIEQWILLYVIFTQFTHHVAHWNTGHLQHGCISNAFGCVLPQCPAERQQLLHHLDRRDTFQ